MVKLIIIDGAKLTTSIDNATGYITRNCPRIAVSIVTTGMSMSGRLFTILPKISSAIGSTIVSIVSKSSFTPEMIVRANGSTPVMPVCVSE